MPFVKGQCVIVFASVDQFQFLFSPSDDESTNVAVIEGKKPSDGHFSLCGAEAVFASVYLIIHVELQ